MGAIVTERSYDYGLAPGEDFDPDMDEVPVDIAQPHIMTVLGPIMPGELGFCLSHEHVIVRPPGVPVDPDLVLDSDDAAVGEIDIVQQMGVRGIVDMSTADYGRDADALRWIAARSNVHLIAVTGHHKALFAEAYVGGDDIDTIAARNIGELRNGIGETGVRPGLIKAGTSLNAILPVEERILRAAARAHRATGVPISTHTEMGTMALEQLEILASEGVAPRHVILCHLDHRLDDLPYLTEVARTGAWISFDQWSKTKYATDEARARAVRALLDAGFGQQVLLSGDLARRTLRPGYGGGPGWPHLIEAVPVELVAAGIPGPAVIRLFTDNPARALAIHPVTA